MRREKGEANGRLRGGLAVDLNEQVPAHVHHEAIMAKKICHQGGNSNLCNKEDPRERPSKTKVESERAFSKCRNNCLVSGVKC